MKTTLPQLARGAFAAVLASSLGFLAITAGADSTKRDEPMMLDVARFHSKPLVTASGTNKSFIGFIGIQTLEGLPFDVRGHGLLYGRKEAKGQSEANFPDFKGIQVERKFDELHLLHAANWAHVEGEAIARVRLNYVDGSARELPIRYGVHVRDWQRLRSEEKESLTDPDSKIVWRGPGMTSLKSTMRLFKSRLVNPQPDREVATLDFLSTKSLAAYDLFAATVANRNSTRPTTPPVPAAEPERYFGGAITVRVVDQITGQPIPGALVDPGMNVDNTGVIASPLYTSTNGVAVIRYPRSRVTSLSVTVEKAGYTSQSTWWQAKRVGPAWWQRAIEYGYRLRGFVPASVTIQLGPANPPLANPPGNK